MKRSYDLPEEPNNLNSSKVFLVERNNSPDGIALINSQKVGKRSFEEAMELAECHENANLMVQTNACNKMDMIGRQLMNLQSMMTDVIRDTNLSKELHNVACNFVKKPGHVYHLYERPSGQKYFGMLSPQEWTNAPHKYLGSYRLDVDQSWTPADQIHTKYEGLKYLQGFMQNQPHFAISGFSPTTSATKF